MVHKYHSVEKFAKIPTNRPIRNPRKKEKERKEKEGKNERGANHESTGVLQFPEKKPSATGGLGQMLGSFS